MTIRISDLTFRYDQDNGNAILSGVNLSVSHGALHFLIGPNGSGKSTLVKCISGLLTPESGKISVQERDMAMMNRRERARLIGYVPQSEVPTFPFTIRQVVVMGRASHHNIFGVPSGDDYQVAEKVIHQVGISHIADRECTSISGGEWQLVLIARALAQEPAVLLMDEPTSHLDLSNQMRILCTIRDLIALGYTVVFVSHNPDQAFLIKSTVSVMKKGSIIQTGTAQEVITANRMKETYGIPVMILSQSPEVIRGVCVPVLPEKS